MSNLAYAPLPQRSQGREQPQRKVEIVSTRAQRRARPRPLYALVAIGGLFALFMAQLLMSISVSDGAYQISSLQSQQADLTRQQQSLGEKVDTLASTQNLAIKAEALGMVQSQALPAFLDVATGKVTGKSHTAKDATPATGPTVNLVPNFLLPDATKADAADTTSTTAATTTTATTAATAAAATPASTTEDPNAVAVADSTAGAPALTSNDAPVASKGGLPIPVTR